MQMISKTDTDLFSKHKTEKYKYSEYTGVFKVCKTDKKIANCEKDSKKVPGKYEPSTGKCADGHTGKD